MATGWQFWSRRVVWLALAIATAIFLLVKVHARMYVSRPALDLYHAVEAVPKDKIIVVTCNWEPGTRGENGPQTEAIIRQCLMLGKRFAIFGWAYPAGPMLGQQIAERLQGRYGRRYGRDWINWGYKTGQAMMIRGWAKNIPGTIEEDIFHKPVISYPVMRGIKTARDVGLVIDITPSSTLLTWVEFVYGIYRTPIGYACTGVMAPEAFPYYDAHQIVGVLKGLAGAAEYEQLLGYEGDALKRMPAQSSSHALMIGLIVLGNIIYFRARRRGEAPRRRISAS
jgi:hypothetical protein